MWLGRQPVLPSLENRAAAKLKIRGRDFIFITVLLTFSKKWGDESPMRNDETVLTVSTIRLTSVKWVVA